MHDLEKALSIRTDHSVLTQVDHPLLRDHNIQLLVKRDDQLHPVISGNKWRKLKYILHDALSSNQDHLISMGGAYSNHLHALAYIGYKLGLKTTGLIRGEDDDNNSTLIDLKRWGMNCQFVDRKTFRELRKDQLSHDLLTIKNKGYWIPEGGSNAPALQGVTELMTEFTEDYDTITLACGTGTTLAGIACALPLLGKNVIGFAALKGAKFLDTEVRKLMTSYHRSDRNADQTIEQNNWSINLDYHFGGFGKSDKVLACFIQAFSDQTNIPLEPIYTGKMFYGLFDQIQQGAFPAGHKIIALHTGGLQGDRDSSNHQVNSSDQ